MKKVIASAGLLALGALSAQTTQAQMSAGADKPWSVSGTLRGFYDDNYNTVPDGALKKSSYGFELRPSGQVSLVAGQTTLNLSYIYSYKYFADRPNGKADQSHDVELFLNHNFNERYSINFTDSFVIAQEPEVFDPGLSQVTRVNGDNLHNSAAINFTAELTHLLTIVLGYSNSYFDYQENSANNVTPGFPSLSALLDRMEQYFRIDSRWQITDTSTGVFGYMFGAVNYFSDESINVGPSTPAGNPLYVAPDTRNNYSHSIYVGLDHSFRSDLSFSGRAGVQIMDYFNAPVGNSKTDVGPYVDLSLNYTYMDGGVLAVGFHDAHQQTDLGANGVGSAASGTAGNFKITEDEDTAIVYLNVTQTLKPISPKLVATGSFQYAHSTFNGGVFNNGTDDFYLFGLNFAYQFTHYISGELGYNYTLLNSDVPNRNYDRNQVYIGITASY